jgi:Primase C terminal 2 (PriCT-2)
MRRNQTLCFGEVHCFLGSLIACLVTRPRARARPWPDADRIFNLPALQPLKDRTNWVLWRWEWNEKTGEWDKPPFQVADQTKGAANNRSSNWARLEDALSAAVESQILGGVGFCLTGGLVCFDLDRCRNAVTGEVAQWARDLIEACSRSITERTNIWTGEPIIEGEGCYVEVTPSLTGLRIWGYGCDRKIKYKRIPMPGEGVLEVFRGTNRYLTVTGAIFENCNGAFKNLDNVIYQYQAAEAARQAAKGVPAASGTRAKGQSNKERPWSPAAEAELRGALSVLDADDRGNWFRFGGAIHDLQWEDDERDIGREIWDDWSGTSPKFDSFDQDKTWEGFQNRDWDDGNTTVASIFHEARARGWRPPGQRPLTVAEIEADDWATITPAQTPPSSESSPDAEAPSEPKEIPQNPLQLPQGIEWGNFYAHAEQGNYWFLPTGKLWPAKSVNARLPWIPIQDAEGQPVLYTRGPKEGEPKMMAPSAWLDRNQAVQSLTWSPGLPPIFANARKKLEFYNLANSP